MLQVDKKVCLCTSVSGRGKMSWRPGRLGAEHADTGRKEGAREKGGSEGGGRVGDVQKVREPES